tara:strand:- start:198 stop:554 length:357 start_codon:yes stop_codon:yes gene_type:complete
MSNTPAFKFTNYSYGQKSMSEQPDIEIEHTSYDHDMDLDSMLSLFQNFLRGAGYPFEAGEYITTRHVDEDTSTDWCYDDLLNEIIDDREELLFENDRLQDIIDAHLKSTSGAKLCECK